jgi:hypothetical protein
LFNLLTRYRYLRSTYLHAFAGGASQTRFKERLGDLFHEGYLDRPAQQWEFAHALCRPAVYEIGRKGMTALCASGDVEADGGCNLVTRAQKQFLHTLLICEMLASIELAARANGCLRFIGWTEILARAPDATRSSARPLSLPVPSGGTIVPDAVFGLEYRSHEVRTYRFFALEADRGTMPISRSRPGQTSLLGKLTGYREILAQQIHKAHWGIPNLLILTATNSEARMRQTASLAYCTWGETPNFLFKTFPSLHAPAPDLLQTAWWRQGIAPLRIDEP